MEQYPIIPNKNKSKISHFWVFDKLDGSNIRCEWSKKRGFYKFGSRKRLLGTDQGILYKAEGLINLQEKNIREIFNLEKIDRAVCFFEFFGDKSFAGNHINDDQHKVILFDVDVYKKGLISPDKFINMFAESKVKIPTLLYYGIIDQEIENLIHDGKLEGMTFEGVVCKSRRRKKWKDPIMYKIKNKAWIDKVKASFSESKCKEIL